MKVYETEIVDFGSSAEMFKAEKMVILFGDNAPDDLADFSYIIKMRSINGNIEPGMVISFDEQSYQITAVGEVVEKNLSDLGHITLNFDGSQEADLPGTLYLEDAALPDLAVGTTITIQ